MKNFIQQRCFFLLSLAVLLFALYSFMLQGEFKNIDDEGSIVRNVLIKDIHNTGHILGTSYFGTNDYYRPLVLLSYMLEYHCFGLNAVYYYLDNILIHFATSVLVFLIFGLLFSRRKLVLLATFLYAIHPVHWEAVANISGRAVLLSTFFVFLSFWFFAQRKKFPLAYVFSLIAFGLGLLCKESAVVLPLVLLSYQFFLGRSPKERLRKWTFPVWPFFLLLGPYLFLRQTLGITEIYYARDPGEALLGFLTFLRGMITYLRLFFLPIDLHFDRSHRFLAGLINFDVLIVMAFYGLAGWLLFKFRRKISPLSWFLLSWFVIELLPVSQILVSIGIQPGYISLAEHFLYAASIGFLGLAAQAAYEFYQWNIKRRIFVPQFLIFLTVCFCGFLMLALVENNIYASRETSMLERTLRYEPGNGRIRLALALIYIRQHRFADAEKNFRQALNIDPIMNIRVKIGLGKSLCDQGKYWEGLEVYDSIPDAREWNDLLVENRKLTLKILRQKHEAALALDPNDFSHIYALGVVAAKSGEVAKAIDLFRRATQVNPQFREAWFNLAASYALSEQWSLAIEGYKKTLRLSSQDDPIRYQANLFLARILRSRGDAVTARAYEQEAARIQFVLNAPGEKGKK